jgi:hypothetical protein
MKTNKIKEPWEFGMKGSLMNLQLDEDLYFALTQRILRLLIKDHTTNE